MSFGFNQQKLMQHLQMQEKLKQEQMAEQDRLRKFATLQGTSPLRPEFTEQGMNPIANELGQAVGIDTSPIMADVTPEPMGQPDQSVSNLLAESSPAPQMANKPAPINQMMAPPAQDKPMGLFDRIGRGFERMVSDPNFKDRLLIGLQGLTMNPNQALVEMAQDNIKRRRDKADLLKDTNMTVDYLEAMGFDKEAQMIRNNPRMAAMVLADVQSRRKAQQEASAVLAKEQAKGIAEARVNLPSAMGTAETAIASFDDALKLSNDELESVLGGFDSRLPTFRAKTARVESILDRASGQSAMAAFESLKGAGAITEAELMQARQAFSRLDNKIMSPEDYRQALTEAKQVADNLFKIAQQRAAVNPQSVMTDNPSPSGQDFSGFKLRGPKE